MRTTLLNLVCVFTLSPMAFASDYTGNVSSTNAVVDASQTADTRFDDPWFPPLVLDQTADASRFIAASQTPLFGDQTLSIGVHQSEFASIWTNDIDEDIKPIPAEPKVANVSEPATLGLLGLGLAAFGLMRSRRR